METVPIWVFGLFSHFSGTQIFNNLLYVSFNTFFTAVPIIWFSTFDWQYEKKVLLRSPRLYRIGMDNVFFSTWASWRWVLEASIQSSLILILVLYSFCAVSPSIKGRFGTMEMAGDIIFTCYVLLVNNKVLVSSYLYTFWALFFIFISDLIYFLVFYGLTKYSPATA